MQVENRPVIDLSAENARQICDRLQPGDLIFRHGTKKGVDATFIRVFQQKVGGYSDVASNVTHVAIYAGQGKVIHAVPPMVCEDDLASYFAGSKISIVTWDSAEGGRVLRADSIISHLRQRIGIPYPRLALMQHCLKEALAYKEIAPRLQQDRKQQLAICSTVIFDSFDFVLDDKNPLYSDTVPQRVSILLPAHLFVQPGLIDLSLT